MNFCYKALVLLVFLLFYTYSSHAFEVSVYNGMVTSQNFIEVAGTSETEDVKVSGKYVDVSGEGKFSVSVPLLIGKNILPVSYNDGDGWHTNNYYITRVREFIDIPEDFWAREVITDMVNAGLIEGYPGDRFEPTGNITKGDLLTWLVTIKGYKLPQVSQDLSEFITYDNWMAPFVVVAFENNMLPSENIKQFNPFQEITRQEALRWVLTNFQYDPIDSPHSASMINNFAENNPDLPEYIHRALKAGIIIGASDKWMRIDLNRPITRAEIAKVVYLMKDVKDLLKKDENEQSFMRAEVSNMPELVDISVSPERVERRSDQLMIFKVKVMDTNGIQDIRYVYLDYSPIIPGKKLLFMDNGDWGDKTPGDGIYTLQVYLPETVSTGNKDLQIVAADYAGWQVRDTISFIVLEPVYHPPQISTVSYNITDDMVYVTLDVADQDNDLNNIYADFGDIRGGFKVPFEKKDGSYVASQPLPKSVRKGDKMIVIKAIDKQGLAVKHNLMITVK